MRNSVLSVTENDPGSQLVESYDEERARAMNDAEGVARNDTSFMVRGGIDGAGAEEDELVFWSDEEQWVTVVLLPEYAKLFDHQAIVSGTACPSVLATGAARGYDPPAQVTIPHATPLLYPFCVPLRYDHEATFDDFDVELTIEHEGGFDAIVSDSARAVDWIVVRVPAGSRLTARIALASTWDAAYADAAWGLWARPSSPRCRLIVVGSTRHFAGPELARPASPRRLGDCAPTSSCSSASR